METTAAVHARLSGDGTLTGMLSAHLGAPAVFSGELAPPAATLPYVLIQPPFAGVEVGSKNSRLWEEIRDVQCWAPEAGSLVQIEAIALRVRTLLHEYNFPGVGSGTLLAEASGPVSAPGLEGAAGLVVTVRIIYKET